MNKKYYSFGNIIKVIRREHRCVNCHAILEKKDHRKVVSQQSEEAKFYNFYITIVNNGKFVGDCEFIHKVFYCPVCQTDFEFITQLNMEDIDIFIHKTERRFSSNRKNLKIEKKYETLDGLIIEQITSGQNIKNLCLYITLNDSKKSVFKTPLRRKTIWERPYYFEINKRKFYGFVKEQINNERY